MKNPKITEKEEYAEGFYRGVYIDNELLCICYSNRTANAVIGMIEALVESHGLIRQVEEKSS